MSSLSSPNVQTIRRIHQKNEFVNDYEPMRAVKSQHSDSGAIIQTNTPQLFDAGDDMEQQLSKITGVLTQELVEAGNLNDVKIEDLEDQSPNVDHFKPVFTKMQSEDSAKSSVGTQKRRDSHAMSDISFMLMGEPVCLKQRDSAKNTKSFESSKKNSLSF